VGFEEQKNLVFSSEKPPTSYPFCQSLNKARVLLTHYLTSFTRVKTLIKISIKSKQGRNFCEVNLLNERSCLDTALGMTIFITIIGKNLVTVSCDASF
jgi:hypothetical protein